MRSSAKTVGILSWDYENPKGGLGRAMQDIAHTLSNDGNTVIHLRSSMFSLAHQFLYSLELPARLQRFFKKQSLDAVLLPSGPGGVFLPRRFTLPAIVIVYHTYLQQSRSVPGQAWKRIFIPAERRTIGKAKLVLCYAQETYDVLVRHYGVVPERLRLLPQILPLDRWHPSPKKISGLCVCVARLEQRKNVDVLLRAWSAVKQSLPLTKLIIVGDGHLRRSVDAQIARLHGIERVASLPDAELRELVSRAELALCPSFLEGFGLAAAEGFMTGTSVIAGDSDGLRSLLGTGERGMLVDPLDATAWSSAINELLHDGKKRAMFVTKARRYIEERHDPVLAKTALLDAVGEVLG